MIRFQNAEGVGTLDVAEYIEQRFGGIISGVKDGVVRFRSAEGRPGAFSLAQWAENNQAEIMFMEGYNSAETAIDVPPNGMNYFDQVVFFQDGMDMDALTDMFPQAIQDEDGTVKVLDSDGLWKIMWSPFLSAPEAPLTHDELVQSGEKNDPRLVLRTAGVAMLFGLAGKELPKNTKNGGVPIAGLIEVLKVIARNAPLENRFQIGKIVSQTTGLDPWKFTNAVFDPDAVGKWLKAATELNSFQYRSMQADMAEDIVTGLRLMAKRDFDNATEVLVKQPETKELLINLKQVFAEFIQLLVGLDLLRDISRSTGLNEWVALNEDNAFDKSKLPEMPEFVTAFVKLLRHVMPIVKESSLSMARGKNGLRSIFLMMHMIDDCIFSLVGVPDHQAKSKMFLALRKVQTLLENKLSFLYQPDPLNNKDGLLENPFRQAKEQYSQSRDMVYKLCQTPKEAWNNTLLEGLRGTPNLEVEYDKMPAPFAKAMKSFVAMDASYDMQPWIDVDHASRTHDAFSEHNESFGLRPPEAGYLAKNQPRVVINIAETLLEGATFLSEMPEANVRETMRNPQLLSQMFKMLMTASTQREIGTVEILNKFGGVDGQASPDPRRIWDDPQQVEYEQQRQIQELMGEMAQQQAMQNQQKQQQGMQEQAMRQEEQAAPQKAGKGPQQTPAMKAG